MMLIISDYYLGLASFFQEKQTFYLRAARMMNSYRFLLIDTKTFFMIARLMFRAVWADTEFFNAVDRQRNVL